MTVNDFSRQSTIPSAQRHGWGQLDRAPHSIGAFSVRPIAINVGQIWRNYSMNSVSSTNLPEHLKSGSWRSATFCPFSWLGDRHLVLGASRDAVRKYLESHDRWQSHAKGLSESRRALNRSPTKTSLGSVVKLLLFNVLRRMHKKDFLILSDPES